MEGWVISSFGSEIGGVFQLGLGFRILAYLESALLQEDRDKSGDSRHLEGSLSHPCGFSLKEKV